MNNHVYKIVELAGTSPISIEGAIEAAISRASTSIFNIDWFEVIQTRGYIENNKIKEYQVVIKVGFRLID